MNAFDAIILGIIQGLTEFLPISSSGHLVLGKALLGLHKSGISLEIWLHLGTLIAVLVYFRRRLMALLRSLFPSRSEQSKTDRKVILALIIGTIPAGLIGVLFRSPIETVFASPKTAASMLIVTAVILLLTVLARNKSRQVNAARGLGIGLAQAVAILPGISRSGSTIACAMFLGIEPALAAEFSFLLAIPAIGGAFVLDLIESGESLLLSHELSLYFLGMLTAFIFGLASIHYLLKIIRKGKFFYFGFYCLAAGVISLIWLF